MRPTLIDIRHDALRHNLNTLKRHAPTAKVLAMVKSDAYGHGIRHVLPALMQADAFGVASFEEGLLVHEVCQNLPQKKDVVLMEGVFDVDEWHEATRLGFGCVVHCASQLEWALAYPAKDGLTRTIWLKYNTGMNRLGFGRDEVLSSAKSLINQGYDIILTSHFACADDKDNPANHVQIARFGEVLDTLKAQYGDKIQGSLCNSAGIINFSHAHHDWVRAGIALYGGTPLAGTSADALGLSPVMSFTAQIFAIHELDAGEQVGYGGLWTADKPTCIGVLSVGYGDGYPRVVNGAKVLIIKDTQAYLAPIVGRVAMDMMMIDISGTPAGVGDTVVLWGDDLPADSVASWANTISYELFCKTTKRPTRRSV